MSVSAREGGAAAAVAVAARAVMADVDVCGEIITRGLVEADTRHHAAKCLDAVAAGETRESLSAREGSAAAAAAAALLPWLPWLECDLDDDVVGRATSAAAAAAVRAAPADRWTPLEPLLRGLFHTSARRRAAAAEGLARALDAPPPPMIPPGEALPESVRAKIDPFGVILRHGDPASAAAAYAAEYTAREPVTRPNTTSSAFGSRDVAELVDVLAGDALGPSVRCAAADQLCICAGDARLESDVASPTTLATAARLAAAALAGGEDASAAADVGAAALKFLAAVVAHSRAARRFFSELAPVPARDGAQGAESEWRPYGRAAWLFSLVFHPRQTVRERVAKFVVYVVFAPTADIAAAHAGVPLDLERAERVYLPDALLARLRFPVPVAPLPAVARATPNVDDAKVRAVLSQRLEVKRLGGAAGVLATLERLMYAEASGEEDPRREEDRPILGAAARVADATLRWASPASSAMTSLARLAAATTHDAATEAATLLRGVLAFGPPGANAIVTATWPDAARRILRAAPRTAADARLWALLSGTAAEACRIATTPPSEETRRALVDAVVRAGVPSIYRVHSGGSGRRALFTTEATRDAPAARHPVAAVAALGPDGGETAAASAAAAAAAANLAAAVLDAAVAASAAAAYGVGAGGVSDPAAATEAATDAAAVAVATIRDSELVDAVVSRLVSDATVEYGARVAGARCLASVARACSLASDASFIDAAAEDLAATATKPLLTHVCSARLGGGGGGGTASLGGGGTASGLRPEHTSGDGATSNTPSVADLGAATGGALVDAGLDAFAALVEACPPRAWSSEWADHGASFWLTRLSRDRVASRRAAAWRLLAHAAGPGARPTAGLLARVWPEAPSAATRVALDASEAPAARAAACHFVASCLSSVAVADADADAEGRRSTPLPDVVPLLNRRDVWRGLANVFVACVARTEPHVRGFASDSALRMTHSAASEPTVSDPAAAAALRRGAAAALLAAARLAPAVVGVAMAPKPGDAPVDDEFGVSTSGTPPPAFDAALRALHPAPWRAALAAPPPEVLSWAEPPTTAAEDAASAAATVAALAGALAAGELERCADDEGASASEREELRAAASCFASARLACDTVAVPATAAALAAAAAALISTPPPRAGGAPRARDAPRRAAIARAFSRSASGLAAVLSAAPDPGRGEGATAAWGCLGYAPAACAAIIQLAADGAATPAAAGRGGAGAGLAEAARSACQLVATLFRSPASARVVMSRAAAAESDSNAAGAPASAVGPVGARLATSLAKLWRAQAVGVPGGRARRARRRRRRRTPPSPRRFVTSSRTARRRSARRRRRISSIRCSKS